MDRKNLFRRPFCVALLLTLGACATVTEEERSTVVQVPPSPTAEVEVDMQQGDTARLVLFRRWNGEGLVFLGTGPMVLVDGQEIGRCLLGEGSETQISTGEHVIRARTSDVSERRFRVEPGQTAFVECRYTVGAFSPNVEFDFVEGRD